jgi:hypothetical protein
MKREGEGRWKERCSLQTYVVRPLLTLPYLPWSWLVLALPTEKPELPPLGIWWSHSEKLEFRQALLRPHTALLQQMVRSPDSAVTADSAGGIWRKAGL